MKKLLILASMFIMTACYNTKLIVGDISPTDPVIRVNTVWNHHIIYGLVPLENATMKTSQYVANQPNYVIKTYTSFLNALVSSLTCGIYTPTSTAYYLPLSVLNNGNQNISINDSNDLTIELE